MSTSETKERAIRLVFPDGGDWSRWYSTRDTARYLGKTAAAVRAWVNRYRAGQDHLTRDDIQARRHGVTWVLRFHRRWEQA